MNEAAERIKTSVSIARALHKEMKVLAATDGKSVSELYEAALRQFILMRKLKTSTVLEDYPE